MTSSSTLTAECTLPEADRSGYKGDSVGKKLARVVLWTRILKHLDASDIDGRIAYLASRDGGDASILCALGWPASKQLAIDRDPGALAAFSRKFPEVPTALGEVDRVISKLDERFAAIYLDFCSPGTNQVLDTILRCVQHVAHQGRFAYCVMRGRERGAKSTAIKESGVARKEASNHPIVKAIASASGLVADDADKKYLPDDFLDAVNRMTDGRSDLFQEHVQKRLIPLRISISYMTYIAYHSETRESAGVPMMIDDWSVERIGRGLSLSLFQHEQSKSMVKKHNKRIADYRSLAKDLAHGGVPWSALMPIEKIASLCFCNVDLHNATLGTLVELSYLLEDEGIKPSSALNVEPGTLAAWRAHHTRSGYEVGRTFIT